MPPVRSSRPPDRRTLAPPSSPRSLATAGAALLSVAAIGGFVATRRGTEAPDAPPRPPAARSVSAREPTAAAKPARIPSALRQARLQFETRIVKPAPWEKEAAPAPPRGVFDLVRYKSPVGPCAAYITPDPGDGRRHPAVLWAHGGFGGIDDWLFEPGEPSNDQSASAFREAGIVLMCPSWRGENDNPGRFELFYGEVDDYLAARDHLAALPYVDPERIYFAGHSSGGTIVLLAAEMSDAFRAAFVFGGTAAVDEVVADGEGYGNTPFDPRVLQEGRLRSPKHFVTAIRRPTFYFEGEESWGDDVTEMAKHAKREQVPFRAFLLFGANHFDILAPLTKLVARKILADAGERCAIDFTDAEMRVR